MWILLEEIRKETLVKETENTVYLCYPTDIQKISSSQDFETCPILHGTYLVTSQRRKPKISSVAVLSSKFSIFGVVR